MKVSIFLFLLSILTVTNAQTFDNPDGTAPSISIFPSNIKLQDNNEINLKASIKAPLGNNLTLGLFYEKQTAAQTIANIYGFGFSVKQYFSFSEKLWRKPSIEFTLLAFKAEKYEIENDFSFYLDFELPINNSFDIGAFYERLNIGFLDISSLYENYGLNLKYYFIGENLINPDGFGPSIQLIPFLSSYNNNKNTFNYSLKILFPVYNFLSLGVFYQQQNYHILNFNNKVLKYGIVISYFL